MDQKKRQRTPKIDTPAKRRDCLAVLCHLPIRSHGYNHLIHCGLAIYQHKLHQLQLTAAGHALAMKAILEHAPHEWIKEMAHRVQSPYRSMEKITPEDVIKALGYHGNYGYGGKDAGYTWPMSLETLRLILNLHEQDKTILSRLLKNMKREFEKYRVRFGYFPTGWRHESIKLNKQMSVT